MTLQPGQITGQDISPTANILGTQIADKTLLFRNFSEATFKIVKIVSGTTPVSSAVAPGGGGWVQGVSNLTIAHGLSFTPIVIPVIMQSASRYSPAPTTTTFVFSATSMAILNFGVTVDATNVTLIDNVAALLPSGSLGFGGTIYKCYLLEQTSNL